MSNQKRMSPKRATIVAIAVAGTALILAVGAYAYDSTRDDLIAKGVTVAGVDVGGMRASKARVVLREELLSRLERPVRVAVAGRRFRLTADRARVIGDIDGMVAAAVDESRSGGA
jgi:hypothetical protein